MRLYHRRRMTCARGLRHFLVLLCAAALAGCAAGGPHRPGLGDWVVQAHNDPKTGKFSHCALTARRGRTINFYVTMSALKALHLGFEHRGWRWTPGDKVPVRLRVDDQPVETFQADAAEPDFLWVYWADWTRPSMHQQDLRVGRTLALDAADRYFTFDLKGMRPAVRALADCARAGLARG